jgi:hypothetical protein
VAKQKTTCESIIKAWKEADARSEKPVGANEVAKAMHMSPHWIWKLFAGKSLTDMKLQHGIRLSPQEKHLSDDELFSMLDKVMSERHTIPGWNLLNEKTGIAESTWKKKLGGRKGCSQQDVYRKYHDWLQVKKPNSTNLKVVTAFLQKPPLSEKKPAADDSPPSQRKRIPSYQKKEGRVYGQVLNFSNLTYEPNKEAGVVFLFGMISKYLGFDSIMYLGDDFPDCEGMWRVGSRRQLQHVKIEFQLESSGFKSDGHDPEECDVIVCWEHDWKECPSSLKVIELKSEIKKLRERPEFKD